MTSLRWTKRLQQAVDQVRALERAHVPGRDSMAPIEIAKVALADVLLAAVRQDLVLPRATPARVTTVRRPTRTTKTRR